MIDMDEMSLSGWQLYATQDSGQDNRVGRTNDPLYTFNLEMEDIDLIRGQQFAGQGSSSEDMVLKTSTVIVDDSESKSKSPEMAECAVDLDKFMESLLNDQEMANQDISDLEHEKDDPLADFDLQKANDQRDDDDALLDSDPQKAHQEQEKDVPLLDSHPEKANQIQEHQEDNPLLDFVPGKANQEYEKGLTDDPLLDLDSVNSKANQEQEEAMKENPLLDFDLEKTNQEHGQDDPLLDMDPEKVNQEHEKNNPLLGIALGKTSQETVDIEHAKEENLLLDCSQAKADLDMVDLEHEKKLILKRMLGSAAASKIEDEEFLENLTFTLNVYKSFYAGIPQHCSLVCLSLELQEPPDCCWNKKQKECQNNMRINLQTEITVITNEYLKKIKKRLVKVPLHSKEMLESWCLENSQSLERGPYIKHEEVDQFAQRLGLTSEQVKQFIENWRARKWDPLHEVPAEGLSTQRKGKHFRHSTEDKAKLKAWMEKEGRPPNLHERETLSKETSMTSQEIRTWFSNFQRDRKAK